MVSVVVTVLAPSAAEIVTTVLVLTPTVVIAKFAVVDPEATVTLDGTVAEGSEDDRFTTTPVDPAAAERVTVPVELNPPYPCPGETDTLVSFTGLIVKLAVFVVPDADAVMVAVA